MVGLSIIPTKSISLSGAHIWGQQNKYGPGARVIWALRSVTTDDLAITATLYYKRLQVLQHENATVIEETGI